MTPPAPPVYAGARIVAGTYEQAVHEDELKELSRRHGVDPHQVNWIEWDLVDLPLLRFGVFLTNEDGKRYLACGHGGKFVPGPPEPELHKCVAAMLTVERILVGELPSWWRPEATSD